MRVGTRKSKLALIQTEMFLSRLHSDNEIVGVSSSGDMNREAALRDIGGSGLFVNEINSLVLDGTVDCAVHSGKDLPGEIADDLEVVSVFEWKAYHDVMIFRDGYSLENASVIGTSSPRRETQLKKYRKDVEIRNLRGNVDTRLSKLRSGEYDGIMLSEAAMTRMYPDLTYTTMDERMFVPAAGQGIIAVVARRDSKFHNEIQKTEDGNAKLRWDIERSVSGVLQIGCTMPNGIFYNPETSILNIDINDSEKSITYRGIVHSKQEAIDTGKSIRGIIN